MGLNADQPEDDEDVDSVRREGDEREGRDVNEGDTQGRGEKKKRKGKVRTRSGQRDAQPRARDIFENLSLPNGEDKKDRQASRGRHYSRYSKGRKCNLSVCSWSRQPGSL